jgi:hypothetical protein
MNSDTAEACIRCGKPLKPPPSNGTAWKLGAIGGALLIGGVFGIAMAVSGSRSSTSAAAEASQSQPGKSAFQQSFDASFKNSCQATAMRAGNVSRAVAENYCSCALEVFNKTHSMSQASASCKKYVFR